MRKSRFADEQMVAMLREADRESVAVVAKQHGITEQGIETALIDPGKPCQNGATESFNAKFRDECLSLEWFRSRAEAKVVIETCRQNYNDVRPHSSLGYLTPAAFAARLRTEDTAPADVTGRGAALPGASAPRPVTSPSRKGHTSGENEAVNSS